MSDENQKWGVFLHRSNYRAFPIYKTRLNGWFCYQPFSNDGMPERRINGRSVGVYAEKSAAQRVANQANGIFDSHQAAISEAQARVYTLKDERDAQISALATPTTKEQTQ